MKENLYIIIDKKDLKRNFKKKVDLLTFNEFILSEKEKSNFNNIYPNPIETSLESQNIIIKTKETKVKIIEKLKDLYLFKEIKNLDELLEPLLEIKISRFYYLENIIPDYKRYILIQKRKNKILNSKYELILAIDSIYCKSKIKTDDFYNKFYKFNYSFFNNILLKIQKLLINSILISNKKETYFISDHKAYFIKNLKTKIKNKNNIILYYSPTNSYLRIILLIFKQLYKLINRHNINEIGMFLLPENKLDYNYKEMSNNIKKFLVEELKNKYSKYLLKQLYYYLLNTKSIQKYLFNVFRLIKFKNAYFHSIRFPDLFSFSRVLLCKKNNVTLISHGTHTCQNDDNANKDDIANKIASESLGIGLVFSKEKRINLLSQSIYCDEFLDSMDLKYKRINRLFNNEFDPSKQINSSKENRKTRILLIGTVKKLGARRYYFESSAEFIASINNIYNKLKKYKQILEIIVRIRDVSYEIDNEILNNAFKDKKDLIKIKNKNSIYEEIYNCDCLISYSSTTLEEGLMMNKPVMCFGLPRYNHFKLYENENMQTKTKYLNKNLKIIEKSLGKKFILRNLTTRKINYTF